MDLINIFLIIIGIFFSIMVILSLFDNTSRFSLNTIINKYCYKLILKYTDNPSLESEYINTRNISIDYIQQSTDNTNNLIIKFRHNGAQQIFTMTEELNEHYGIINYHQLNKLLKSEAL